MKNENIDLINEETIFLTTYGEKASFFRGRIIDTSISVEMKLAEILTDFFNQDAIKRQFMFSSIFTNSDLSFSSKAKILSELLSKFFPEVFTLFPEITNDLQRIIHLRNRIDHSMLDTSSEFVRHRYADRIRIIFFIEGQRKEMIITDDDFNASMKQAAKIIIGLDHIKSQLNLN